jgi:hypothetical protein
MGQMRVKDVDARVDKLEEMMAQVLAAVTAPQAVVAPVKATPVKRVVKVRTPREDEPVDVFVKLVKAAYPKKGRGLKLGWHAATLTDTLGLKYEDWDIDDTRNLAVEAVKAGRIVIARGWSMRAQEDATKPSHDSPEDTTAFVTHYSR